MKKDLKHKQPSKTTGHEWDGIEEYNNSDPFWLRGLFYAMVLFALVYCLLFPSSPVRNDRGLLNWSATQQLDEQIKQHMAMQAQFEDAFSKKTLDEVLHDPQTLLYAKRGGEAAFNTHCVACHHKGGVGAPNYPNLRDDVWIWGGKVEDIYITLLNGVRSGHEDARDSQMAAFGRDKILTTDQVTLLAHYVLALPSISAEGSPVDALYKEHCSSCHGLQGEGNREFGAPPLHTAVWLYGGDFETVYDVIYNGRAGVMPSWRDKLPDSTIRKLAIYVHSLGGGE